MPEGPGILDVLRSRRAVARWRDAARGGRAASPATLARLASEARGLRREIDGLLALAEARVEGDGETVEMPPQADWGWRPAPWRARMEPRGHARVEGGTTIAGGVTLFHDCPLSQVIVTQAPGPAPHALVLEVMGFEGGYLSLSMDLPEAGRATLRAGHVLRLAARVEAEPERECYARLSLRQGPNTDQLVSRLAPEGGVAVAEFDLGMLEVNARKLSHAWIDVILEEPAMSRVAIHDLSVTRRPRAEL